jgi:methionyl aminopeptidase
MDTVATELSSVVAQISASDAQRVRAMAEGGAKLHRVKTQLAAACTAGTPFEKLEALAQQLIAAEGATPNFVLVPKYHWATCIMRNDEMCHGIPRGKTVGKGDVVKIDVGLLWQGYNLDTTVTVCVDRVTDAQRAFVDAARAALEKAIVHATANSSVFDVSSAMQKYMERRGYGMVFQLTGHG